jgi:hypothetical protein
MGIEPTSSAWKAEVLPLNYTRLYPSNLVEGGGFEPPKAEPPDLQSGPFDRSGTPPNKERIIFYYLTAHVNRCTFLALVPVKKIHRLLNSFLEKLRQQSNRSLNSSQNPSQFLFARLP